MHLLLSKQSSGTPSPDELKLNQGEFSYSTEEEIQAEDKALAQALAGTGYWQGKAKRRVSTSGMLYLGGQKIKLRVKSHIENGVSKLILYPVTISIHVVGKLRYLLIVDEKKIVRAAFVIKAGMIDSSQNLADRGKASMTPLPSLSEYLEDLELRLKLSESGYWQGNVRRKVNSQGIFYIGNQMFQLRLKKTVENEKTKDIAYSVTIQIQTFGKQHYMLFVNEEQKVVAAFEIKAGKIDPDQNLVDRVGPSPLPSLSEYLEDLEFSLNLSESGHWQGKVKRKVNSQGIFFLANQKFQLKPRVLQEEEKLKIVSYSVVIRIQEVGKTRYLLGVDEEQKVVAAFEIKAGKIDPNQNLVEKANSLLPSLSEYLEDLEFRSKLSESDNWQGIVKRKVNSGGIFYLGNQKLVLRRKFYTENGKQKSVAYSVSVQIQKINQQRYFLILDESDPGKKVLSGIPIQSGQMVLKKQILYSFKEAMTLERFKLIQGSEL